MPNPLKWKYEDPVALLVAAGFGALLGFVNGYAPGHEWLNLLWAVIGAVVVAGAVYCYRVFR
jgi:uncharacterized membrane protein (Fun14 family)